MFNSMKESQFLPFLVVYHILSETETWPFLRLLLRMNSSEMQYRSTQNERIEYATKHLKKSNAACFYTPVVLKLLMIVPMWKQHEKGN